MFLYVGFLLLMFWYFFLSHWRPLLNSWATRQTCLGTQRFVHHRGSVEAFERRLRTCAAKKDLLTGRCLHSLILISCHEISGFLGCCLIRMFACCGSFLEANLVFTQMENPAIDAWQAIIEAQVLFCFHVHAIGLYLRMQKEGVLSSKRIFLCVLGSCTKTHDLFFGRIVHDDAIRAGQYEDVAVGSCLVDMYTKCRSVAEAQKIFDRLPIKNVVTWNSLIAGYAMACEINTVLHLLEKMQRENVCPVRVTFLGVLKACNDLRMSGLGNFICMEILKFGLDLDAVVGNALVDLYGKFGRLQDALIVFKRLHSQDVVSWNVLIAGYVKDGQCASALELFWKMGEKGVNPDEYTFSCAFQACSSLEAGEEGQLIHNFVLLSGLDMDAHICSTLLRMYTVCNKLEEAHQVLAGSRKANSIMWGIMIAGYVQHKRYACGLELYSRMQHEDILLCVATFPFVLNACGNLIAIKFGISVHNEILTRSLESELEIGNALIDMYCKCGCFQEAQHVFDYLLIRDVVTWNSLIAGFAQHEKCITALVLFERMQQEKVNGDKVTLLGTLKCCAIAGTVIQGMQLHHNACYDGLEADMALASSLVDVYAKLGCIEDAGRVFSRLPSLDVVSCSAMVMGYAKQGLWSQSTNIYNLMVQKGITPDNISFAGLLKACSKIGIMSECNLLHDEIIRNELDSDLPVGNALIDMYSKRGWLPEARRIFEALPEKNVASWNTIMTGYAENDDDFQVLELFEHLQQRKALSASKVTYLCILKACGNLGSIAHGFFSHDQIIRSSLERDLVVSNMIIDTYARCGALEEARLVFDSLLNRDVVSWSALIAGHAKHSGLESAQHHFYEMLQNGVRPVGITFTSILGAYSNAGQVKDCHHYFKSMREDYGITPSIEHCNCMVDILGRAGCIDDASKFLNSVPMLPNVSTWMSLLTSCRTFGNVEFGRLCFEEVSKLDPHNSSALMIMSKLYAEANMWYEVHKLEEVRTQDFAWKKPGKACIDIGGKVFQFTAGVKTMSWVGTFFSEPPLLFKMLKERGYIPLSDALLNSELDRAAVDTCVSSSPMHIIQ